MEYFWILTTDDRGDLKLIGCYSTEYEAQLKADKLDREYEIISLPTSNDNTATRMIKHKEFDKSGRLVSRVRHGAKGG